ncbi:hypothetical protein DQ356_03840 [Chryseobacterium lacus]|uniref:Uncharacterized protein n=1 Tax=Chryseobacterium lacus TaxID=2058346 RepID=A0A368N0X1_9FLAO|nr:hypothetical protein DQ356_03840 [Chryseobacterium lacus]
MADSLQSEFFPPVQKRLKYSPPLEGWQPTKEDDGVVPRFRLKLALNGGENPFLGFLKTPKTGTLITSKFLPPYFTRTYPVHTP